MPAPPVATRTLETFHGSRAQLSTTWWYSGLGCSIGEPQCWTVQTGSCAAAAAASTGGNFTPWHRSSTSRCKAAVLQPAHHASALPHTGSVAAHLSANGLAAEGSAPSVTIPWRMVLQLANMLKLCGPNSAEPGPKNTRALYAHACLDQAPFGLQGTARRQQWLYSHKLGQAHIAGRNTSSCRDNQHPVVFTPSCAACTAWGPCRRPQVQPMPPAPVAFLAHTNQSNPTHAS
jgi:hypothetical protein